MKKVKTSVHRHHPPAKIDNKLRAECLPAQTPCGGFKVSYSLHLLVLKIKVLFWGYSASPRIKGLATTVNLHGLCHPFLFVWQKHK